MTVGGVGFQLSSYVISAERGYLPRDDAAHRVHDILNVLANQPQGPEPVGVIGVGKAKSVDFGGRQSEGSAEMAVGPGGPDLVDSAAQGGGDRLAAFVVDEKGPRSLVEDPGFRLFA